MSNTQEIYRRLLVRGTQVLCEGTGEGPYARFEARIAAIQDEVIHLNILSGRNVDNLLLEGEHLTMYFSGSLGWFMCAARRIENLVPGGMTLRLMSNPTRVERREYLRIRCRLTLRWSLLDADSVKDNGRSGAPRKPRESREEIQEALKRLQDPLAAQLVQTLFDRLQALEERLREVNQDQANALADRRDIAVDISGSGIRFATRSVLNQGDFIEGILELDDEEHREIHFTAQVIRAEPPNLGRTTHCVACHFHSIAEHDREQLIRYIFREHRRQLRDSLL
jgi:c-di-GMP-binding flagellar brake protein YcgR